VIMLRKIAYSMEDELLLVWVTSGTLCPHEQSSSEKGKASPSKGP
jgi:hypothetical protein